MLPQNHKLIQDLFQERRSFFPHQYNEQALPINYYLFYHVQFTPCSIPKFICDFCYQVTQEVVNSGFLKDGRLIIANSRTRELYRGLLAHQNVGTQELANSGIVQGVVLALKRRNVGSRELGNCIGVVLAHQNVGTQELTNSGIVQGVVLAHQHVGNCMGVLLASKRRDVGSRELGICIGGQIQRNKYRNS